MTERPGTLLASNRGIALYCPPDTPVPVTPSSRHTAGLPKDRARVPALLLTGHV